ncbi:small conductance mechanosensitive channel [Desulfoprunum benzoelyticum]|uniref:Small conductance mechanosensitive channel n=2 Tax=Desulfoprunum benzoelyticum TaxID=1506996 RepID=A0A840UXW4_9BACT|nr:mechanosensitive ion channel domain-containing protein [Desulfoprunum benzoelyticum]MBB5346319.1 small conductance mechanosensitive channel [Desulfoprunum benzoelyticum]
MFKLQELIALYGLKVIAAIAILVIGRIAAKGIREIIRRTMRRARVDETLISFVSSMCYIGILAFVIIAALSQLGVETASFVVVLGSAGLAVGLALQGSLANFAAGVLMIIFKPFKVGDYVEGGGVAGVVEEIGIFTTDLKSPDNKKIIVPNGKMAGDNIVNHTTKEIRRVDIVAGVSYKDDLDKVKNVLADILAKDDRVLKDPAPTIGVLELADSSVNFAVRPWVKTGDYWDVFFATQESIKKRFDAEGISIPFPQQDVHMHQAD